MDIISDYYNYGRYDDTDLHKIHDIVDSLKNLVEQADQYYQEFYWLQEDRNRRIPLMKYPNGAFRGIVVIPEWPT